MLPKIKTFKCIPPFSFPIVDSTSRKNERQARTRDPSHFNKFSNAFHFPHCAYALCLLSLRNIKHILYISRAGIQRMEGIRLLTLWMAHSKQVTFRAFNPLGAPFNGLRHRIYDDDGLCLRRFTFEFIVTALSTAPHRSFVQVCVSARARSLRSPAHIEYSSFRSDVGCFGCNCLSFFKFSVYF